jgi:hypothetical protein
MALGPLDDEVGTGLEVAHRDFTLKAGAVQVFVVRLDGEDVGAGHEVSDGIGDVEFRG